MEEIMAAPATSGGRVGDWLASRAATWSILLLGLWLRLVALFLLRHLDFQSDAASYRDMARSLGAGLHFVPYWPPGLPLYLAGVQRLLGDGVGWLRCSMLVFYFGLSACVLALARQLTGNRRVANLAILLLAISPSFVLTSVETLTELPAAFLLTLAVWCALRTVVSQTLAPASVLGLALGCLALVRPSALILVLIVPCYLAWSRRRVSAAVTACVLACVVIGSWVFHVHATTKQWVAINSANSRNFYLGNNPQTPLYRTWWLGSHHEAAAQLPATQLQASPDAWNYVAQHPGLFALRTFNRACAFVAVDPYAGAYAMGNYPLPRLAGLAMIAADAGLYGVMAAAVLLLMLDCSAWGVSVVQLRALCGVVLFYAAPYFFAFSHPRYRMPTEPLLMVCAAIVLAGGWHRYQTALGSLSTGQRLAFSGTVFAFLLVQIQFVMLAGRGQF